jgi:hypothetical protein|tara:strand:- start:235 stop:339 length:105 start_codon:yes stop_codon:yes gene_type:complete
MTNLSVHGKEAIDVTIAMSLIEKPFDASQSSKEK